MGEGMSQEVKVCLSNLCEKKPNIFVLALNVWNDKEYKCLTIILTYQTRSLSRRPSTKGLACTS